MPGRALDIGIGPTGDVWVIGTNQGIYRWSGGRWKRAPGAAKKIAVGPKGPWVVNKAGHMYEWTHNRWLRRPGWAQDIGVSPGGVVWHTGGGDGMWVWNGKGWEKSTGRAKQISVNSQGLPFVVNRAHNIYWPKHAKVNN